MKKTVRYCFLLFGITAVVVMLLTFDVSWAQIREMLQQTGIVFPVCVLLWLVIYMMNARAWQVIINHGESNVRFCPVLKMTISGFALNYTTPFGLMGGEPYRILALKPYIGVERATSSVVLYVMMHIYSHFWFWMSAVPLYITLHFSNPGKYVLSLPIIICITLFTVVFALTVYLFRIGYDNGFLMKLLKVCGRLPFIGKPVMRFTEKNAEKIGNTDRRISMLRSCGKAAFFKSLLLEYLARAAGCVEYWLIMRCIMPWCTYADAYIIVAFSSLFSNILFFIPMQLGSKEGSVAAAAYSLDIGESVGLFTALVTRVREMIWIVIGVALMFFSKNTRYERTDI